MTRSDASGFLRRSLVGNAAFSATSGAILLLASEPIARFLGVAPAALVASVGVNLLGFAIALVFLASRPEVSKPLAKVVIGLDVGWVLGTVALIAADVFTAAGSLLAIAVANVVAGFAILQTIGVRRLRGSALAA